jgi:phosphoenolpyruvate carboxykinase (ATP)
MTFNLKQYGIEVETIYRNAAVPRIYELAMHEQGTHIAANGALVAYSGAKTGRSPADKRVVKHRESEKNIWWGDVNIPLTEQAFHVNRETAVAFFNTRDHLYVVDGFAGWDPNHRIKVRVICTRAYHALFMHNMLIRPTAQELATFGEPDWTVYNAGAFPCMEHVDGMKSKTSVDLSIERREFVILGTEYAGEMKKGVFTILNYLLPLRGDLSMHCSANEGANGETALFFGLSGTGKTTLSADPRRKLIGDDEHGWTKDGIFNYEGGCYAKTINLKRENEPEIWDAIRFGSILENVLMDKDSREIDYTSAKITENTRCSYPIDYISNAKIPCVGGHPKNIVFLTCDAFGVMPPVCELSHDQAMYHFISGYTAKVAGTEVGVTEPKATFSACFGAAFLVWHPAKYAELLKKKLENHGSRVWLVNTGWTGGSASGPEGQRGHRMSLRHTRAIIDAIHTGDLAQAPRQRDEVFGFDIITRCPGVPDEVMSPRASWADRNAYDAARNRLAQMFLDNFKKYEDSAGADIRGAAPRILVG